MVIKKYTSQKSKALKGSCTTIGDKSISHRILMLAALASGKSIVHSLLKSGDTRATQRALGAMGVSIKEEGEQTIIEGVGRNGLKQPKEPINLGNAGTAARLLSGVLTGQNINVCIHGDASLSKRPMGRVIEPLKQMGARIEATQAQTLPMKIQGTQQVKGIDYSMPVPSAQVKSAILLAGLQSKEACIVQEREPSRDHTERLLSFLGVPIRREGKKIILEAGEKTWQGATYKVVGDISSAMMLVGAAAMVVGSKITLYNVGSNERRCGALKVLKNMGAIITILPKEQRQNEPVADITIEHSPLKAVSIEEDIPSLIDEIPILAMVAATACGHSIFKGIQELTVKESNRLEAIAQGLRQCGVTVHYTDDSLTIEGKEHIEGGVIIDAGGDHRIAMAFSILGCVAQNPITVNNAQEISSSFPTFLSTMQMLGASIKETEEETKE